jgi:hypothetical protein
MTDAAAQTFLTEHDLHYLDLFALVTAYAARFDCGIKGESDRVTVWIRTPAGAARRARARAAKKVKP